MNRESQPIYPPHCIPEFNSICDLAIQMTSAADALSLSHTDPSKVKIENMGPLCQVGVDIQFTCTQPDGVWTPTITVNPFGLNDVRKRIDEHGSPLIELRREPLEAKLYEPHPIAQTLYEDGCVHTVLRDGIATITRNPVQTPEEVGRLYIGEQIRWLFSLVKN